MMPGAMRNAAIATGKKMTWNINFSGIPVPSKVTQSVVAEPAAASIAPLTIVGFYLRARLCVFGEIYTRAGWLAEDEEGNEHCMFRWPVKMLVRAAALFDWSMRV